MSVLYKQEDPRPILGAKLSEILREAKVASVLWDEAYFGLLGLTNYDEVSDAWTVEKRSERKRRLTIARLLALWLKMMT